MDIAILNEMLKCSWESTKLTIDGLKCGAKFLLKSNHLTIVLTDYRSLYWQTVALNETFQAHNPNIIATNEIYFVKLKVLFARALITSITRRKWQINVNLEETINRRQIKWIFIGKLINDIDRSIFHKHVVRPLIDMVSYMSSVKVVASEDYEELKSEVDFITRKNEFLLKAPIGDPFEQISIRQLYELVNFAHISNEEPSQSDGNVSSESSSDSQSDENSVDLIEIDEEEEMEATPKGSHGREIMKRKFKF